MLPPGIFIWKSGKGDFAFPADPADLAEAHPSWKSDVATCGPWKEGVVDQGMTFWECDSATGQTVVVSGQCETTMIAARSLAQEGVIGEWGSFLSVEQVAGRGQLRRPWVSSPGNLHASLVLPAATSREAWRDVYPDLLPLMVGFIFSMVLQELGADIRIKWPNDLLQAGRKVGGILIEEKNGIVVLGLGLNLATCPPDGLMREESSVSAGVLQIPGHQGGALSLWQTLVNRGKDVYTVLLDELAPSRFLSDVESRLAWLGQRVRVREGDREEYQATITGLSSKGGLVLANGGKETILCSGSIYPL